MTTTTSARAGRYLLAGTALVLAAFMTGCASGSSSSTTSPAAPATTASGAQATSGQRTGSTGASGTGAAATPSAGGTTAGPAQAAGAPACSSRYLRADAGAAQGAAGSVYQVITFTNLNNVSCTLYGYPGVALANGTPVTQVGAAADRMPGSKKTTVTLAPHGVASATLRIVDALNFPSTSCKPVATTWIQIYPPNQTVPLYLGYKSTACSNASVHTLTIDVVKPGKNG